MPQSHDGRSCDLGGGRTYLVEIEAAPAGADVRDTTGGWPLLGAGQAWPSCYCRKRMVLFFQVDIPADVPTFGGDHLLVFQCPQHNDACLPPHSGHLPARFWDEPPPPNDKPFWRVLLHRGNGIVATDADPFLTPRRLTLRPTTEVIDEYGRGLAAFKIGGVPSWAQDPEHYRCPCGADLTFLCQIPENFGFDIRPGQRTQPDGFSSTQYGLFLGNEIYILACPVRCHPAAAWPVNQN